jgi:hypothetical protein
LLVVSWQASSAVGALRDSPRISAAGSRLMVSAPESKTGKDDGR